MLNATRLPIYTVIYIYNEDDNRFKVELIIHFHFLNNVKAEVDCVDPDFWKKLISVSFYF